MDTRKEGGHHTDYEENQSKQDGENERLSDKDR